MARVNLITSLETVWTYGRNWTRYQHLIVILKSIKNTFSHSARKKVFMRLHNFCEYALGQCVARSLSYTFHFTGNPLYMRCILQSHRRVTCSLYEELKRYVSRALQIDYSPAGISYCLFIALAKIRTGMIDILTTILASRRFYHHFF